MLKLGLRSHNRRVRDDHHSSYTTDNGDGSLRQVLVDANDGETIDATGISGVITLTTGEVLVEKSVIIKTKQ